jgi:hypothetical protein
MSLNATFLTKRQYWNSKQFISTILMHNEALSVSGKTNNSIQFRAIEDQQALSQPAGYNVM